MDTRPTLNTSEVRRRFDRAASTFDDSDFVHAVTREGLFARLEPIVIDASVVLDLGCATGQGTRQLAKRFRGARVIGVDFSAGMLEHCKSNRGWFRKSNYVQADARALPFSDQSVDVVFSNLLLPWIDDPVALGREVTRILRDDGLFAFATLGPDSLLGLRNAWAKLDGHEHVNRFFDMHDVGDAFSRAGLRDPVLDVDRLTVSYDSLDALFADLTAVGARNSLLTRAKNLSGKRRFESLRRYLSEAADDDKLRLDLELVYGHCWGGGRQSGAAEVHIDPGAIPRRRR